jgi:superfamily II DNA or RNA helicase
MSDRPNPLFAVQDEVLDRDRAHGVGNILEEPTWIAGQWRYRVRFPGGRVRVFSERSLTRCEPPASTVDELVTSGRFGRFDAFQRAIAVARLTKDALNRSTVYSFNAQRVEFQAYQYRPLLRFLDSEDRRLLIADEVGLGKTIEAGIVLTELEARQDLQRVIVICPSRLREKWAAELGRKFGQHFEIWGSSNVTDYARRVRENPSNVRLRAIMSIQGIRRSETFEQLLAAAGHFDLLILDESHYVRNRSTSSYTALQALTEAAAAILFLSATPIHLKSEDLFNQLKLLRPTEFRNPFVFEQALRRNEGVVRALERLRSRNPNNLPLAAKDILDTVSSSLFGEANEDLVREIAARVEQARPKGMRDWFELDRDVERLHYLNSIVTRTRKRDVVAQRAVRRSRVVRVQWTLEEERIYESLTALKSAGTWPTSQCSFGMVQTQRMAASSLIGTLHYRDNPNSATDLAADGFDESDETARFEPERSRALRPISRDDSKFSELKRILEFLDAEKPNAKVLVFTYFVGTSRYLEDRLNAEGISALRIAGDVSSTPTRPDTDERALRMARFRDDPSVRVMVSTEVGSEGLDFQFCSRLVNYDLPWNPMTVEQRIGRIDRYKQKDEVLQIFSIVVEGTIEERILARLYERIEIFERSIGSLEEILGQVISEIRSEFFLGTLTSDEADRRAKQAAEAIEQARARTEELEREAENLFGHEEFIKAECQRVQDLGRYVTPQVIQSVLIGYLNRTQADLAPVWHDDAKCWRIRFSSEWKQKLMDDPTFPSDGLARLRPYLRDGWYHYVLDGAKAYEEQSVDLLNATHPLVVTARSSLASLLEDKQNRTGTARLLPGKHDSAYPPGRYVLATFLHQVNGVRKRTTIEVCGVRVDHNELIDSDSAERLLHLVLNGGEEGGASSRTKGVPTEAWKLIRDDIQNRSAGIEAREELENRLLVGRRRARIDAEHEHRLQEIERRRTTAEASGKLSGIERLLQGQVDAAHSRKADLLAQVGQAESFSASYEEDPVAVCVVDVVHQSG